MDMRSLLHEPGLALIVGNGINRYGNAPDTNAWNALLTALAAKHLPASLRSVPAGISLTEFYDLLELKWQSTSDARTLQMEFCELMAKWQPYEHHKRIVQWAKRSRAPILTTNFEETLSEAGQLKLYRAKKGGFTDYYPWETYFGEKALDDPATEFGVWHINGMQRYHRSVRLGLTHYMGCVERARGWLHRGNEKRLFAGKDVRDWEGTSSWLHVVFNCPLLIFGLALNEDEVFLRWLLIERARYFRKFPDRRKQAWYVYAGAPNSDGKQYFLEGVGIEPVRVSSHGKIYGRSVWI